MWKDRINRILWLYGLKPARRRYLQISFRYPQPIGDLRVAVRNNSGSDAFIFSEVFDHQYYNLPLPFEPKTILDLGAYTGFTAIYFARKYPGASIACVEPYPKNVELLRINLEQNRVKSGIIPAAAATNDGRLDLGMESKDYAHRVLTRKDETKEILKVNAVSIPNILKKLGWDRINLLKIDIEGYEKILLRNRCEWLKQVDSICIECHEGFGEPDLYHISEEFGFKTPERLPGIWFMTRELSFCPSPG